jgi:hypothetical protein
LSVQEISLGKYSDIAHSASKSSPGGILRTLHWQEPEKYVLLISQIDKTHFLVRTRKFNDGGNIFYRLCEVSASSLMTPLSVWELLKKLPEFSFLRD